MNSTVKHLEKCYGLTDWMALMCCKNGRRCNTRSWFPTIVKKNEGMYSEYALLWHSLLEFFFFGHFLLTFCFISCRCVSDHPKILHFTSDKYFLTNYFLGKHYISVQRKEKKNLLTFFFSFRSNVHTANPGQSSSSNTLLRRNGFLELHRIFTLSNTVCVLACVAAGQPGCPSPLGLGFGCKELLDIFFLFFGGVPLGP